MRIRVGVLAAACAFALGLSACDEVKLPGVSGGNEEPGGDIPPPPPLEPVNPISGPGSEEPAPDPVASDPDPSGETPGTETPATEEPTGEETGTQTPGDTLTDPEPAGETSETTGDTPATEPVDEPPVTPSDPAPADPVIPDPEPEPEPTPVIPAFSYFAPGELLDGSGSGNTDMVNYSPDMIFPIKDAPAYPQSQVYSLGGGAVGGDQCDPDNYQDPWRDNFCETRTSDYSTPFCEEDGVHLGQDIRAGDAAGCKVMRSTPAADRKLYAVVAVEDGEISNIGRYTVNLRAGGRIYRYLHLNMQSLEVELGDEVKAGDVIGYLSNDFGGAATTFHLHFEIKMNTAEYGWAYVPPYMALVDAYARREGAPGEELDDAVEGDPTAAVASTPD